MSSKISLRLYRDAKGLARAYGPSQPRSEPGLLHSFIELVLGWWAPAVRWLGGLTFALYLCHRPLLNFLSTMRVGEIGTPIQQLWLFGMTALMVIAVAHVAERLRKKIRDQLSLWRAVA